MRTSYRHCQYCEGIHQVNAWPHNCMPEQFDLRSELPAPYIVTDNLPGGIHGMRSMSDGKLYDSKSAYYAALRSQGKEIVGNDSSYRPETLVHSERDRGPKDDIAKDIKQATEQLSSMSEGDMSNMMRAICPAEPVIPNG